MFEVRFQVREYEVDSQGVVNHAVYVNYLEHARSFFLKAHGFSYGQLVEEGVHLMVSHMTMDFKASLRSGDEVLIRLSADRHGAKLRFNQAVLRAADEIQCAVASTDVICLKNGRVTRGEFFDSLKKDLGGEGPIISG